MTPPTYNLRHPCAARRGLTLLELLIGLSITAVTCAVLAVLIHATAVGTNSQNDGRRSLVRLQMIKAMLEDELVNARTILAVGPNYVVYWIGDQPGAVIEANNAVNFSELRLLETDPAGNLNIYCAQWPTGTPEATILAQDLTYAVGSDWYSLAAAARGTACCTAHAVASGVKAVATTLDSASPTAARFIHLRIDVDDGTTARQLVLGVQLANPQNPW